MILKWQLNLMYWLWRHATNIIARRNIELAMHMYEAAPWEEGSE